MPAEYQALMAALLLMLAAELTPKPGIPVPDWLTRVRWGLPGFLGRVRRRIGETAARVERIVAANLVDIVARAAREAALDARWTGDLPDVNPADVRGVLTALEASHRRVETTVEDAFRRAVFAAQQAQPGDPAAAVQRVLDDLAGRGVTGYVDAAGRRWNLETYVETVVRSRYAEAALQAYVDVCRRAGLRLARISVNHSRHAACRAWEGKTVSLDGSPRGEYLLRSPAGRLVTVTCDGTLQESRLAGVWHPWCQHRLTAVIPGGGLRVRRSPSIDMEARARRRYLARTARAWDRRTRVAITDQARRMAAAKHARWASRQR